MANAVLLEIRQGLNIVKRNERCRISFVNHSASIAITYVDREGVRTTSTIDHAVGSGDILDVYTQNSRYRFRTPKAAKAADRINELRAQWSVMRAVGGLVSAFA